MPGDRIDGIMFVAVRAGRGRHQGVEGIYPPCLVCIPPWVIRRAGMELLARILLIAVARAATLSALVGMPPKLIARGGKPGVRRGVHVRHGGGVAAGGESGSAAPLRQAWRLPAAAQ